MDELVDIVSQSPFGTSIGLAKFLNCWDVTVLRRLIGPDYTEKVVNVDTPKRVLNARQQISKIWNVRIRKDIWVLFNTYEKKWAYLKPHDYMKYPRVSRYSLMAFFAFPGIPLASFKRTSDANG